MSLGAVCALILIYIVFIIDGRTTLRGARMCIQERKGRRASRSFMATRRLRPVAMRAWARSGVLAALDISAC
jgi:hypothetical protein